MIAKDEIALRAAEKIYIINVEKRVRNKAHYVSLIQEAVLDAIKESESLNRGKQ